MSFAHFQILLFEVLEVRAPVRSVEEWGVLKLNNRCFAFSNRKQCLLHTGACSQARSQSTWNSDIGKDKFQARLYPSHFFKWSSHLWHILQKLSNLSCHSFGSWKSQKENVFCFQNCKLWKIRESFLKIFESCVGQRIIELSFLKIACISFNTYLSNYFQLICLCMEY